MRKRKSEREKRDTSAVEKATHPVLPRHTTSYEDSDEVHTWEGIERSQAVQTERTGVSTMNECPAQRRTQRRRRTRPGEKTNKNKSIWNATNRHTPLTRRRRKFSGFKRPTSLDTKSRNPNSGTRNKAKHLHAGTTNTTAATTPRITPKISPRLRKQSGKRPDDTNLLDSVASHFKSRHKTIKIAAN